jgi:hypothetical protein
VTGSRDEGTTFPVVVDQDSRITAAYGSGGMLFVIDRNGNVILAERGVVPHDRIFAVLNGQ